MSKIKILLVEDNVSTGQMYKAYLDKHGYEVDYAADGEMAYAKIHAGGFDLILLDVRMPKLDGIGVLERLQENPPKLPNGPIVMLTNITDESVVQKAISLGAVSYMDKSNLNPKELGERVRGVLGVPVV